MPKFAARVHFDAADLDDAQSKLEFIDCEVEDLECIDEEVEEVTEETE
jgi:CBS-domain-containing membrane protein